MTSQFLPTSLSGCEHEVGAEYNLVTISHSRKSFNKQSHLHGLSKSSKLFKFFIGKNGSLLSISNLLPVAKKKR
jgi:hypothetical protein